MLRLQKIQLRLEKPFFSFHDHVVLRITVQNIMKCTQKPAKIITQKYLTWRSSLAIPLIEGKKYIFSILNHGNDEKNNEQNNSKVVGAIDFTDLSTNQGNWNVYSVNNQRVGQLTASIIRKGPSIAKNIMKYTQNTTIQTNVEQKPKKVLRILSLLAKFPNIHLKKGYFCLQIGQQVLRTPELKSRSNQLVFIEPRQIQLQKQDRQIQIKIYSSKVEQQQYPIAEARLQLSNQKPTKRLTLMKDSFEVGEIYVQSRIVDKNTINTTNYVENINKLKDSSTIVNQIQQPSINQRYRSLNPSKSIDYSNHSRFDNFGIKSSRISRQSMMDSSMISTISARKRNSVLNENASIVFPKERRFMIYQDRQNEKITYLNQHQRSFQFKFTKSGSRYRGASFGYGEKTDFSKGGLNPGVGNYKLPSIWDRY